MERKQEKRQQKEEKGAAGGVDNPSFEMEEGEQKEERGVEKTEQQKESSTEPAAGGTRKIRRERLTARFSRSSHQAIKMSDFRKVRKVRVSPPSPSPPPSPPVTPVPPPEGFGPKNIFRNPGVNVANAFRHVPKRPDGNPDPRFIHLWSVDDLRQVLYIRQQKVVMIMRWFTFVRTVFMYAFLLFCALMMIRMINDKTVDFMEFKYKGYTKVYYEKKFTPPDVTICVHLSRLRIPDKFPPESKCYGNFTSAADPQRFAACHIEILYQHAFADSYHNLTTGMIDSVKELRVFDSKSEKLQFAKNKRSIRYFMKDYLKEGYKCMTFSPSRNREPLNVDIVTELTSRRNYYASFKGKLGVVDGEYSALIFMHHPGSRARGYLFSPLAVRFSSEMNEITVSYKHVVKRHLEYPYTQNCVKNYSERGFEDQDDCREQCILRHARVVDPRTVPEQLAYTPCITCSSNTTFSMNDTRTFNASYKSERVKEWNLICLKECPVDCEVHHYYPTLVDTTHDPFSGYDYGVLMTAGEITTDITYVGTMSIEDWIMNVLGLFGTWLGYDLSDVFNPYSWCLFISWMIGFIMILVRKYLNPFMRPVLMWIFKYSLDPIISWILSPLLFPLLSFIYNHFLSYVVLFVMRMWRVIKMMLCACDEDDDETDTDSDDESDDE